MATIREALVKAIEERGLFADHATKIVNEFITPTGDPNDPDYDIDNPMSGRWNDDISGYPPQMLAVLLVSLDARVIEWMDREAPRHWARPLFAAKPEPPR